MPLENVTSIYLELMGRMNRNQLYVAPIFRGSSHDGVVHSSYAVLIAVVDRTSLVSRVD